MVETRESEGTRSDWRARASERPGPDTLTALTVTDPKKLAPADLIDAIACAERLLSHLAGVQTTLLTEFSRPGRAGDISRMVSNLTDLGGGARTTSGELDTDLLDALVTDHAHGMAAAEMAAALNISPITARHRVESAVDLHDGLPATHRALTEGLIDRGRAAVIAEHTNILDPDLRTEVESIVLPLAQGRTAGRLRPLIDRAVIVADPDAAERRVKKAKRGREVTHQPLKDQLSLIRAVLPADNAVTVFTLIDLLAAATTTSDERLIGERRADALHDLCDGLLTHGYLDLRGLLDLDAADESDVDTDVWDDTEEPDEEAGKIDNRWYNVVTTNDLDDMDKDHPAKSSSPHDQSTAHEQNPTASPEASSSPVPSAPHREAAPNDHAAPNDPALPNDHAPSNDPALPNDHAPSNDPALPNGPDTLTNDIDPTITTDASADSGSTADSIVSATAQLPGGGVAPPTHLPSAGVPEESTPHREKSTSKPGRSSSKGLLRRQGRRPHLTLTMSMTTLMALDRLPGHLDGYGAITPELSAAIMDCAASLNLVVIDPQSGTPLRASSRKYYRPRQADRDIAGTLAETCRFPSCRQPAWRCDLDHRKAFDHQHPDRGGETSATNLDPLCRRHHLMKHHSDWSSIRQPDGALRWTSPTRHSYTDPPREITLPGELLTPNANPRTTIGLADSEHQSQCAESVDAPEPTPGSYRFRLAERQILHGHVLGRLATLRRQKKQAETVANSSAARIAQSGLANDGKGQDNAEGEYEASWLTATIPSTVAELKARSGFDNWPKASTTGDDDIPPF